MSELEMGNTSSAIKDRVMRRVFGIWIARLFGPLILIELPLLVIGLKLAADSIFFQKFFENLGNSASGFGPTALYFYNAFVHTKLSTQIILSVLAGLGFLFAKDSFRSVQGLLFVTARRVRSIF